MRTFLQDLISHTHTLGILPILKLTATETSTVIESLSIEREVKLDAVTHFPVSGLDGVFGMTNLNKLDLHLKCPEYNENAVITVLTKDYDGEITPVGLNFKNAYGDFENDYRFINKNIINEKIKKLKSKIEVTYDIEFKPSEANIQRLKFQANAHTEETVFSASVINGDLVFSFGGEESSYAGSFVFQSDIQYKLRNKWSWPIQHTLNILTLKGDKTMRISDATGGLQFEVCSGVATYTYFLPAFTK